MSARINKPKVVRPKGRPTPAEKIILTAMQFATTDFQEWQIMNDKVVTGKSVNGWVITITERKKKTYFKGVITNKVPYINVALFGRGPGKMPPIEGIMKWIRIRGIKEKGLTTRKLAYRIAAKIAKEGTDPPYLQKNIRTSIVHANTRNVIKKLSPVYTRVKGLEFVGGIVNIMDQVNKITRRAVVSSSYDKFKGKQTNFDFNAGTSFFKVKPKIKDNFFTFDADEKKTDVNLKIKGFNS